MRLVDRICDSGRNNQLETDGFKRNVNDAQSIALETLDFWVSGLCKCQDFVRVFTWQQRIVLRNHSSIDYHRPNIRLGFCDPENRFRRSLFTFRRSRLAYINFGITGARKYVLTDAAVFNSINETCFLK